MEALAAFVKQQLSSSIRDFADEKDLEQRMDKFKRNVIAYFANKTSDEFRNFQVAFLAPTFISYIGFLIGFMNPFWDL